MASMNCVILTGRVVKDPELHYTPAGKPVVDVSMAIDDGFGDNKSTIWMTVTFWGKTAETAAQCLKKGHYFGVQGSLKQREETVFKGTEKERKERKTTVWGHELTLMPGNKGGAHSERPPDSRGGMAPLPPGPPAAGPGFPPGVEDEDEIPF